MNINLNKFIELNNNLNKSLSSWHKVPTEILENWLINNSFSKEYIEKKKDMICKIVFLPLDLKANKILNLDLVKKNNIDISGDLMDFYLSNNYDFIPFFIVGSKSDTKSRITKSPIDKDFSDFVFNYVFNNLEYKIVDIPQKKLKYKFKKRELENYALFNIYAVGHYSGAEYSKICFLPDFDLETFDFKNSVLDFNFNVYELDGKHSETQATITRITPTNLIDYIDLEVDINFLELLMEKCFDKSKFNKLSFKDLMDYQEQIIKNIKNKTTITVENELLMAEFLELIEKIQQNKQKQDMEFKLAFKLKYPQFSSFI